LVTSRPIFGGKLKVHEVGNIGVLGPPQQLVFRGFAGRFFRMLKSEDNPARKPAPAETGPPGRDRSKDNMLAVLRWMATKLNRPFRDGRVKKR
jgi:hypothetical protein